MQISTVHSAFPDIPLASIAYSLSRTRSAQRTSEEILERGYLVPPPDGAGEHPWVVAERERERREREGRQHEQAASGGSNSGSTAAARQPSLIERYGLVGRADPATEASGSDQESGGAVAGAAESRWESTPEGRAAALKQRKERMILEARR